jgi:hypothetical protein
MGAEFICIPLEINLFQISKEIDNKEDTQLDATITVY